MRGLAKAQYQRYQEVVKEESRKKERAKEKEKKVSYGD